MYGEISYFRKKSKCGIWYKFNKNSKVKISFKLKRNIRKIAISVYQNKLQRTRNA